MVPRVLVFQHVTYCPLGTLAVWPVEVRRYLESG